MKIPAVLANRATWEALPPEMRGLYVEQTDKEGNAFYTLDVDTGEDFDGLVSHSEWGALARAYHRKKDEGAAAKERIAELEAERGGGLPADFDRDLWDQRHEIMGTGDLRRQHKRELDQLEREHTAELSARDQRISQLDVWLTTRDKGNALRAAMRRAGVKTQFESAVAALLEPDVVMVGDVVMAKSQFGHLSLDEHTRRFLASEDGQAFASFDAPRYGNGSSTSSGGDTFSKMVRQLK
jgi:hypothetical protein